MLKIPNYLNYAKMSLIITKIANYAKKIIIKSKKNYQFFIIKLWETFIVRLDLFKAVLIAL